MTKVFVPLGWPVRKANVQFIVPEPALLTIEGISALKIKAADVASLVLRIMAAYGSTGYQPATDTCPRGAEDHIRCRVYRYVSTTVPRKVYTCSCLQKQDTDDRALRQRGLRPSPAAAQMRQMSTAAGTRPQLWRGKRNYDSKHDANACKHTAQGNTERLSNMHRTESQNAHVGLRCVTPADGRQQNANKP